MSGKGHFGVFIIESLSIDDENENRLDGLILREMLGLSNIQCEYIYIRTRRELEYAAKQFSDSQFKYLHVSSHGEPGKIHLTLDTLQFAALARIVGPYLSKRRLFLSACEITTFRLAKHLIPHYNCVSLVGSPDEIRFDKSGLFWSSFYHLMHELDESQMRPRNITETVKQISKTFSVNINYYSLLKPTTENSLDHLKERLIRQGKLTKESTIRTPYSNICRQDAWV